MDNHQAELAHAVVEKGNIFLSNKQIKLNFMNEVKLMN